MRLFLCFPVSLPMDDNDDDEDEGKDDDEGADEGADDDEGDVDDEDEDDEQDDEEDASLDDRRIFKYLRLPLPASRHHGIAPRDWGAAKCDKKRAPTGPNDGGWPPTCASGKVFDATEHCACTSRNPAILLRRRGGSPAGGGTSHRSEATHA